MKVALIYPFLQLFFNLFCSFMVWVWLVCSIFLTVYILFDSWFYAVYPQCPYFLVFCAVVTLVTLDCFCICLGNSRTIHVLMGILIIPGGTAFPAPIGRRFYGCHIALDARSLVYSCSFFCCADGGSPGICMAAIGIISTIIGIFLHFLQVLDLPVSWFSWINLFTCQL